MPSTSWEYNRYFRQLLLPGVGDEGQQKLQQARILVIGTGGLGSPVLYYLAAAGVGTLGFMDDDQVDITNLQRQILHWEKDLAQPKSRSTLEKLQAFNSSLHYEPYSQRLTEQNAQDFIPKYDLVIAAVDNNETRALINRTCYFYKIPWIDGGIREFVGTLSVFLPPHPPCYACMYNRLYKRPEGPIPLMGALPGVIGCMQAMEALKLILGLGKPITGRRLVYDALAGRWEEYFPIPDPTCTVCGGKR